MSSLLGSIRSVLAVLGSLVGDTTGFLRSWASSRTSLVAENLFLRKQLAFYQEHQIRPRRLTNGARISLVFWSRFFAWKSSLLVVKPATLIGWHRKAFKLFWKWKSRSGRRRLPADLCQLIAQLVRDNPTWGQERIADELWLKLGINVSPRTVRAYWPAENPSRRPRVTWQSWSTFIRNHAQVLLACDFMVAVTARFRILYVFVLMEVSSRRILHCNVTAHPTAEWTTQQLREAIPSDHSYRFLIHDRHATFSAELDAAVANLGIAALKTPVRTPQANAFCEFGPAKAELRKTVVEDVGYGEVHRTVIECVACHSSKLREDLEASSLMARLRFRVSLLLRLSQVAGLGPGGKRRP